MEEQFILRVPPSVAQRLHSVLSDKSPGFPEDESIDLAFSDDGRTGKFVIGDDVFEVSLVDLPCVVESYKTYDDSVLIKTADIAQMILVREPGDAPAPAIDQEYKHGLTAAMRDARRRRFRRQPDLNPDYVQQIEDSLQNIMAGGTARNIDVEVIEQEEDEEIVVVTEASPSQQKMQASNPTNPNANANQEDDDEETTSEYEEDSEN